MKFKISKKNIKIRKIKVCNLMANYSKKYKIK